MVGVADPDEYQSSEEGDSPPATRIVQRQLNGCLVWETVLKKETVKDKYGFIQANGKLEFKKRLTMTSATASSQSQQNAKGQPDQVEPRPFDDEAFAALPGPDVLVVRKINEDGLLERWNKRHPEARVKPQDRILSVNNVCTIEGMQTEIRRERMVIQFCRYPERFRISLKKDGRRLGFRFERPTNQHLQELRISEVLNEGALPDHNSESAGLGLWHYCVLPDMRIEATNGITGDAWEMAEELKRCESVTIQIRRAEALLLTQQQVRQRLNLLAAFHNSMGNNTDNEDQASSPGSKSAKSQRSASPAKHARRKHPTESSEGS